MHKISFDSHQEAARADVLRPGTGTGFKPGFFNAESGDIAFSRFANGYPAPVHVLDGLPEDWFKKPGNKLSKQNLKKAVISGFIREGHFFTREEAASFMASEDCSNEAGSAYYDAF